MKRSVHKPVAASSSVGTFVDVRAKLLDWYDQNARALPWRVPPAARRSGARADPYRVWLSEIMLQQTTVAAAKPYFEKFLDLFPTVQALADAPRETALSAWAGLGYYSRARNLHAAARILAESGFPDDEPGWRALPGVGAYTAAAVAAIAFDRPANVVDGNVERVMARLHAVQTPLPAAKPELRARAADYVRADRPGDWAQALMDLGAVVCTPRAPRCGECPIAFACEGFASGRPEEFPRREAKPEKPKRFGAAFALVSENVLLVERRPEAGLLAGMRGLPTTPWRERAWPSQEALAYAPADADWRRVGSVRHVFTHFSLTLDVYAAFGAAAGDAVSLHDLNAGGLPTVFRKAAALALSS